MSSRHSDKWEGPLLHQESGPQGRSQRRKCSTGLPSTSTAPIPSKLFRLTPFMWSKEVPARIMRRRLSQMEGEAECMQGKLIDRGPYPLDGETLCMPVAARKRSPSPLEGEALHMRMRGDTSTNMCTSSDKSGGRGGITSGCEEKPKSSRGSSTAEAGGKVEGSRAGSDRGARAGRAFCRHLGLARSGQHLTHHHVRLPDGVNEDLGMLRFFLESFNGITLSTWQ
ncbi:hypothetical protein NDU88_002443 [Pleurodeles waltl]|uniref:Uncharacterized protein n=1 Tax=Pleurodeles waltl TaxID=8319 RepID=A0AAV7WQA1_PLEWA|nr:hypothetical protein NDU88_002443 [Pleurodeles waltl]